MKLLMCRACGEFVVALPEDDGVVPITDECPKCDGREFKDTATGESIRTD